MGWVPLATAVITFIVKLIDMWSDRNKKRRKIKKEALDEVREGIKERNVSRINAGFGRINRLR